MRHSLVSAAAREPDDLGEWQQIVWDYAHCYATSAPDSLLQDLTGDLLLAGAHLGRLRRDSAPWRDMCRVLASLAVFAAHTFAELASFRASRRWWRTARSYADQCADHELRTWVYGREVIGALYERGHCPLCSPSPRPRPRWPTAPGWAPAPC